jgi:hypothetical protein
MSAVTPMHRLEKENGVLREENAVWQWRDETHFLPAV